MGMAGSRSRICSTTWVSRVSVSSPSASLTHSITHAAAYPAAGREPSYLAHAAAVLAGERVSPDVEREPTEGLGVHLVERRLGPVAGEMLAGVRTAHHPDRVGRERGCGATGLGRRRRADGDQQRRRRHQPCEYTNEDQRGAPHHLPPASSALSAQPRVALTYYASATVRVRAEGPKARRSPGSTTSESGVPPSRHSHRTRTGASGYFGSGGRMARRLPLVPAFSAAGWCR